MRLYIVETPDGEWNIWRSTPFREAFRRVPKVKPPGVITLDGFVYVVDPSRMRRIPYRQKRTLKMTLNYHQVQVWRQNDPEPRPLFDAPERDDDITGEVMSQVAKAKRIKDLLTPEFDMMTLLLIFSVLGNIILALLMYSVITQNGGA